MCGLKRPDDVFAATLGALKSRFCRLMKLANNHDFKARMGSSGPVVLDPDYSKLKVVGVTRDVARRSMPSSAHWRFPQSAQSHD